MSSDGSAEFAGRAIKAAMTGGMSGDVGADIALTDEECDVLDAFVPSVATRERHRLAVERIIAERVEAAKAEALREAADDLEGIRDEHEAEDEADGCTSRFCGGWLLGQTHAAQGLRARAAALDPEATP